MHGRGLLHCKNCGLVSKNFKNKIVVGEKDKELIHRVGNKYKHSSTLEHLVYTFEIKGISRLILQELARHRIASLTVKSTRYTLKELKNEKPFRLDKVEGCRYTDAGNRASKYINYTGYDSVDYNSIQALENLRAELNSGMSNDIAKYCLPECYKTDLIWTINARSLQNFLKLRSSKSAHFEIRELAENVYWKLPYDHKYLFSEFVENLPKQA